MGKKVTKKAIRDNMKCFTELVRRAHMMVGVVDGEKVDITPYACGAQAMAWYVQGLVDGDFPIEADMTKLVTTLTEVAFNEHAGRHDEDESDDGEDEGESFYSWLDRLIARGSKAKLEGGAEDDADAE